MTGAAVLKTLQHGESARAEFPNLAARVPIDEHEKGVVQ